MLPQILARYGKLPAMHAEHGEAILPGKINIAPPNFHLLVQDGHIKLEIGPREHGFRPAIDPLFRSAALAFGPRLVGVILTGTLGDGVAGLRTIKEYGGVAIVQDPNEAVFSSMPLAAIENVPVDFVLPLSGIAQKITELARARVEEGELVMQAEQGESETGVFIQEEMKAFERGRSGQARCVLSCPECGGVLWELGNGDLLQYNCHVGHAYSLDSLMAEQSETVEEALWTAARALEERASLIRRIVTRLDENKIPTSYQRFREEAEEAECKARTIRQLLAERPLSGPPVDLSSPEEQRGASPPG
jgi:two-component system chemotaxis response regulator CheB